MSERVTKRLVQSLKPADRTTMVWDPELKGFGVKVMPSGQKVLQFVYRFPRGRAGTVRRYKLGDFGQITVEEGRRQAQELRGEVAKGIDPMATLRAVRKAAEAAKIAPKRSIEQLCTDFVERYAKKHNRSWEETDRILKRHVVTAWGKRQISDITRADVNDLLDDVADNSGGPMANAVLAQVRKMFNWHATRDDTFNTPIVRGMARVKPKDLRRDRVLTDTELRALWTALEEASSPFRQLVRFLLLTAQRREEVAQCTNGEFDGAKWTIPAARYKTGRANVVTISADANSQFKGLLKRDKPDQFVFSSNGSRPFSGFSKSKRRLDAKMESLLREATGQTSRPKDQPVLVPWRLHDLRRTAKTLMQRAGVRPDISERVLGHVIGGVEGIYDQHDYAEEKAHALRALATILDQIIHQPFDQKVVSLAERKLR